MSVTLENGGEREVHSFTMLDQLFLKLELSVGAISNDTLCDIEFWSRVSDAYYSAMRSFAFTASSFRSLKVKLVNKGFDRNVAQQAIDILRDRGIVDEGEISLRRAELMVGKMWGQTRILSKLREEGFGDDVLEGVYDYLESVDMVQLCRRLIEKKYGGVPAERSKRDKLCTALYRYGYSPSEIKQAIGQ